MPAWNQALISESEGRDLVGALETATHRIEQLEESAAMTRLELSREDAGWTSLISQGEQDMSREGIIRHAQQHRMMVISNPIVRRAAHLVASYVFGQGVGTVCQGDAANDVVQDWLDDATIRRVFAGAEANKRNHIARITDGNLFFALPTDQMTGAVTVRDIPMDEVTQIITAPGDREKVQFYVREWSERNGETGRYQKNTAAYPALSYQPRLKTRRIQIDPTRTAPVQWNTPVYHMAPNRLKGQQWGTADAFSAVPWARAYSEFLDSWLKLMKALSRIAYRVSSKNSSQSQQMRGQAAQLDRMGAGSTVALTGDAVMEPMPKTGATIDAESGRPIATMVAAGFMLPVTTLMSDPGQTGARAVAETLNLPTRLSMEDQQEDWREARRQILEYVLLKAVEAPQGVLRGKGKVVRKDDSLHVVWAENGYGTLTIDFPPLDDTPLETLMDAISKADATGKLPPLETMKQILRALKVRDIDETLEEFTDDQGRFIDPYAQTDAAVGREAARAHREGRDAANYA